MRGARFSPTTVRGLACGAIAALLLAGCGEAPSRLLAALGIPHLERVAPQDVAPRRAAGALLVQLDEPSLPAVGEAIRMGPQAPMPAELLAAIEGGVPLLVVAPDEQEALALGARLSRAGAIRVGIVVGGRAELAALASGG
jgi:hypothetical protein